MRETTDLSRASTRRLRRAWAEVDLAAGSEGDDAARLERTVRLLTELLRRRPGDPALHFDDGLLAKWRRDWRACLAGSAASLARTAPEQHQGDPAAWNLGIAATAVHEWSTARLAWSAFGLDVADGRGPDEPIDADLGLAPVRLNPEPRFLGEPRMVVDGSEHETEVVWGTRLCPARIRIENIPTPGSGHRWHDVVLHDGDTVGSRWWGEHELGVFEEIALWRTSGVATVAVTADAPTPDCVSALEDLAHGAGAAAEDWSGQVRMLCRACSEGTPDPRHDHPRDPRADDGWHTTRTVALAGPEEVAEAVLSQWVDGRAGRVVHDVRSVVPAHRVGDR